MPAVAPSARTPGGCVVDGTSRSGSEPGETGRRRPASVCVMSGPVGYAEPPVPAFLFDLDGTLIDSVYQHVIAWRAALSRLDIDLSVWRIHRRIGMSGGLFVSALLRETGRTLSEEDIALLQQAHGDEYLAQADSVRPRSEEHTSELQSRRELVCRLLL